MQNLVWRMDQKLEQGLLCRTPGDSTSRSWGLAMGKIGAPPVAASVSFPVLYKEKGDQVRINHLFSRACNIPVKVSEEVSQSFSVRY